MQGCLPGALVDREKRSREIGTKATEAFETEDVSDNKVEEQVSSPGNREANRIAIEIVEESISDAVSKKQPETQERTSRSINEFIM